MSFKLSSHGVSDIGLVRTNNEDAWLASIDDKLFLLADGLGGHQAGEVASREAVEFFLRVFRSSFSKLQSLDSAGIAIISTLRSCFERTNTHVHEMAKGHDLLQGMGTTFCAVSFHQDKVAVSHVGDSRIYLLRNNQFEQLTRDHCWTRKYMLAPCDNEKISKGVLTRAMGTASEVEPTIRILKACPKDVFLICSDGLSDMLPQEEIEKIVRQPKTIGERVRMLVAKAKQKGGCDNITVVLTEVQS